MFSISPDHPESHERPSKKEGRKTGVESNGWSSISATAVEHSLCFKKEKKLNDSILQLPPSIPLESIKRCWASQLWHAPHWYDMRHSGWKNPHNELLFGFNDCLWYYSTRNESETSKDSNRFCCYFWQMKLFGIESIYVPCFSSLETMLKYLHHFMGYKPPFFSVNC